ncbi:MAG: hypothetical protein ACI89X_004372 [Planctomycetota bacterium]
MINLCERRWVKGTSLVALTLLIVLALVVHSALQAAHTSLDERQAKVAAAHALQRSCEMGVMPSESELAVVASLFPTARLTCSRIEHAMYLTFEGQPLDTALGPVVMQGR